MITYNEMTKEQKLAHYEKVYMSRKVSAEKCLEKKHVALQAYKAHFIATATKEQKAMLASEIAKI